MDVREIFVTVGKWSVYIILPLVVIRAIHKLWFHPLSKYPGPLIGKLTDFYTAIWASKESLHLETYRNIQKYGPILRQSPNRLIFNTVTAVQDIYFNHVANKGEAYIAAMVRSKHPSTMVCVDKAEHRRKRKLISPAFSERTIREIEPSMKRHIDVFLHQILASTDTNSAVDLSNLTKRLGIDIIGQLVFGYEFKTQTEAEHQSIPSLIEYLGWRLNAYMQFPALAGLEKLIVLGRIVELGSFARVLKRVIKDRMAEETNAHHDLYSIIMNNHSVDERGKSQGKFEAGELWPESVFLLSVGGLTTATAISATFFYLSCNPKAYAALASEIRSTFASDGDISMVSWREHDKDEAGPLIVDGRIIPRGTSVGISPYALLHNEEYFPDPFSYTPERWLDLDPREEETEAEKTARANMRKAFIPFLVGDRGCAGKTMAYTEASLTLARSLWFFDFEKAPGEKGEIGGGNAGKWKGRGRPDEYQLGDIIVTSHEGPNLVFKKRGDHCKELE